MSDSLKTRVLFISSAEHPGADTFVHALIMRHLDRSRFEVHAAAPKPVSGLASKGYDLVASIPQVAVRPTVFLPSRAGIPGRRFAEGAQSVAAAVDLARLCGYVRRHGIALVHSTDRPRDAVTCALVGRLTGAQSIIHAHVKCGDWMGQPLRRAMRRADALIGVSQFVKESLVAYGYAREKCHAVLNGIELERWDPAASGAAVRREFGIAPDAPVIVCAARLFRWKGQDLLLRAMPAVSAAHPSVRVLIVGADDEVAEGGRFSRDLRALADGLGIADRVIFTGQRSDMPAVFAACDVFALPSNEEPFGLVFAEAMAMKKPVAAVANGGTLEVVEHQRSGLLAAPGDVDSFAQNLALLLRDRDYRRRLGEYGRRAVETRFSAASLASRVAAVYESIMDA